jgi:hypothetical protein
MRKYIQFYHMSVPNMHNDYCSKVIEACGSDSVQYLDGRQSDFTNNMIGERVAKANGFVGYKIMNTVNDRLQETDWNPKNITLVDL